MHLQMRYVPAERSEKVSQAICAILVVALLSACAPDDHQKIVEFDDSSDPLDTPTSVKASYEVTTSRINHGSGSSKSDDAFFDISTVDIRPGDDGEESAEIAKQVAQRLAASSILRSTRYVPFETEPEVGSQAPGATFEIAANLNTSQKTPITRAASLTGTFRGGSILWNSNNTLSSNQDAPVNSHTMSGEFEFESQYGGIRLGGNHPLIDKAAQEIADKLGEHMKALIGDQPQPGQYPEYFYPEFAPAPEFAFLQGAKLVEAHRGLFVSNDSTWKLKTGEDLGSSFDAVQKELEALDWHMDTRDEGEQVSMLRLTKESGYLRAEFFPPSRFGVSSGPEPESDEFILRYRHFAPAGFRDAAIRKLLDAEDATLAQLLPFARNIRDPEDSAKLLRLMETSSTTPSLVYLRQWKAAHQKPWPQEVLRRAFWGSFEDRNGDDFEKILRQADGDFDMDSLAEIEMWNPAEFVAWGWVDVSSTQRMKHENVLNRKITLFDPEDPQRVRWICLSEGATPGTFRYEQGSAERDQLRRSGMSWGSFDSVPVEGVISTGLSQFGGPQIGVIFTQREGVWHLEFEAD